MSLDGILWFSASTAEAAVIGLLLFRRFWRNFPIFLTYSVWTLVASLGLYFVSRYSPASYLKAPAYINAYFTDLILDSILLFAVLVELAWSVLRPIRRSLSPRVVGIIAILILVVGAAVWPFTAIPGASPVTRELAILMHLQQALSILQVLAFFALLAFSQVLSIGWRDRELQIASGLGFYSLVGLIVAMLLMHPGMRAQYNHLSQIAVAAYLCSLVYWIVSFVQKEEKRREFTPQMQSMLLAVASAARATRISLTDSASANDGEEVRR